MVLRDWLQTNQTKMVKKIFTSKRNLLLQTLSIKKKVNFKKLNALALIEVLFLGYGYKKLRQY